MSDSKHLSRTDKKTEVDTKKLREIFKKLEKDWNQSSEQNPFVASATVYTKETGEPKSYEQFIFEYQIKKHNKRHANKSEIELLDS